MTTIEDLRTKIKQLNKKRDEAILEKGLAADENKDLRENATYDYWVEKEMNLTTQIHELLKEIHRKTLKKKSHNTGKTKEKPVLKVKDFPKNKWI